MKHLKILGILLIVNAFSGKAAVKLNNIFSNHMVLQRNIENPVWGTADAREKITVDIAGQTHATIADKDGKWKVKLNPMQAGGPYNMTVTGKNKLEVSDILVGEVWVCSGQSNMQFELSAMDNSEVEIASANCPQIRLLRVPQIGNPTPQSDIDADWKVCSPDNVADFSAVGYLFGKRIHEAVGVPVGLIHNSWGGTPIEAYIPRDVMDTCSVCADLLRRFDEKMKVYTDETLKQDLKEYDEWLAAGKPGGKKWPPVDQRTANKRPANLYNGMVHPIEGYGIRGAIWYQGEANASNPTLYRTLFPMMIKAWRDRWGQGDFPFYWVQLADFQSENPETQESNWAALREAQTNTLSHPNTGQAVIIDAGEGRDIHPRNKQSVANRLVRQALANDYGYKMVAGSPCYQAMEIQGRKIVVTFSNTDKGLYAFDTEEVKGFAIAGKDGKFVWAKATIVGKDKIEVYADEISAPVSVRYGWADNPVVNLYDRNGLPVTPFRTDQ